MFQWSRLFPPIQGVRVLALVMKLRSLMAKRPKQKTSNVVTNSIETLKMAHKKKKMFFKKCLIQHGTGYELKKRYPLLLKVLDIEDHVLASFS